MTTKVNQALTPLMPCGRELRGFGVVANHPIKELQCGMKHGVGADLLEMNSLDAEVLSFRRVLRGAPTRLFAKCHNQIVAISHHELALTVAAIFGPIQDLGASRAQLLR